MTAYSAERSTSLDLQAPGPIPRGHNRRPTPLPRSTPVRRAVATPTPARAGKRPGRRRVRRSRRNNSADIAIIAAIVLVAVVMMMMLAGKRAEQTRPVTTPQPPQRVIVIHQAPPPPKRQTPRPVVSPQRQPGKREVASTPPPTPRAQSSVETELSAALEPAVDENGYEKLPADIAPDEMLRREREENAPVASWLQVTE